MSDNLEKFIIDASQVKKNLKQKEENKLSNRIMTRGLEGLFVALGLASSSKKSTSNLDEYTERIEKQKKEKARQEELQKEQTWFISGEIKRESK